MDEDELELDPAFQTDSLGSSGGGGLGAELGGDFQDSSAPRTPRRGGGGGGGSGRVEVAPASHLEGFSLADELASALSPAAQRRQNRQRMAEEYGLELDDDEGDEEEEAAHEMSFGGDSSFGGAGVGESLGAELGGGGMGMSLDAELGAASTASPARTSARAAAQGDEELARQQEAAFSAASSAILDSVRTTDAFLARLRGLAGSSSGAEGSRTGASAPAKHKNSEESDTAALEESASTLVRRLTDGVKDRERQVREVWEADRELSRSGLVDVGGVAGLPALQLGEAAVRSGALEEVAEEGEEEQDPLDGFSKEDLAKGWPYDTALVSAHEAAPPTPAVGGAGSRRRRSRHQGAGSSDVDEYEERRFEEPLHEEEEEEDFEDGQFEEHDTHAHPSAPLAGALDEPSSALPPAPPRTAPPSHTLAHLRLLNASVLSSLSALHEHVQVQRAAQSDAGRRLRSVRGVLAGWRAEWDSADRSRVWLERYEGAGVPDAATAGGAADTPPRRPEDIRLWTRQQLERFERVLADAEVRAQELLRPVSSPALEELMQRLGDKQASAGQVQASA